MALKRFQQAAKPQIHPDVEAAVETWSDLEDELTAAEARYAKYLDDWAADHPAFARLRQEVSRLSDLRDGAMADAKNFCRMHRQNYTGKRGFGVSFSDPITVTLDPSVLTEVPELLEVPGVIKDVKFNMDAVAAAEAAKRVPPLDNYRLQKKTTRAGRVEFQHPAPAE